MLGRGMKSEYDLPLYECGSDDDDKHDCIWNVDGNAKISIIEVQKKYHNTKKYCLLVMRCKDLNDKM